jgi:hypothetical protein
MAADASRGTQFKQRDSNLADSHFPLFSYILGSSTVHWHHTLLQRFRDGERERHGGGNTRTHPSVAQALLQTLNMFSKLSSASNLILCVDQLHEFYHTRLLTRLDRVEAARSTSPLFPDSVAEVTLHADPCPVADVGVVKFTTRPAGGELLGNSVDSCICKLRIGEYLRGSQERVG